MHRYPIKIDKTEKTGCLTCLALMPRKARRSLSAPISYILGAREGFTLGSSILE